MSEVFLERVVDPQVYVRPKRTSEEVKRANKAKWEQGCMELMVKNERHIDPQSFDGNNPVVQAIGHHSLSFWLHPNSGYNLELV